MTPMVATSVVPHLGRLACAYFHTSTHLIRQPGPGKVDRVGTSPILISSLCAEIRMDTRCFVYFPSNRAGKNRSHHTTLPSTKCRANRSLESQTIVILGHRRDTRARWTGVRSPLNLRTPVRSSPRHDSLFLHGAEKPLKNEDGKHSCGSHIAAALQADGRAGPIAEPA